jgi:hypothetical protein
MAAAVKTTEINGLRNPLRWPRNTHYPHEVGTNFADRGCRPWILVRNMKQDIINKTTETLIDAS